MDVNSYHVTELWSLLSLTHIPNRGHKHSQVFTSTSVYEFRTGLVLIVGSSDFTDNCTVPSHVLKEQ